jgi:hypothetical protein
LILFLKNRRRYEKPCCFNLFRSGDPQVIAGMENAFRGISEPSLIQSSKGSARASKRGGTTPLLMTL